ncbi:MAG: hypothetical protein FJ291_32140 [Planctomycetes bacterium]|nr:hypothetical protein [Planctomycetota bacterium]
MRRGTERRTGAFAVIELLVVVAVIGILLGLGFSVYRGAGRARVVAQAENDLKQIGTAFQLYFNKYGSYPQQGADLAQELGPFAKNPGVFVNPGKEEPKPGQTLSQLYREPTIAELDVASTYVTSLPLGNVVLILRANGAVDRVDLDASVDSDLAAEILLAQLSGEDQARGGLNVNPRNNHDFEFEMRGVDPQPDGRTTITRDDLLSSKGSLFYKGKAVYIRMNPKGNSNSNTFHVTHPNGVVETIDVKNGIIYVIEDSDMTLLLENKGQKGAAMGRWWLDINASAPKITLMKPSGEIIQVIQK